MFITRPVFYLKNFESSCRQLSAHLTRNFSRKNLIKEAAHGQGGSSITSPKIQHLPHLDGFILLRHPGHLLELFPGENKHGSPLENPIDVSLTVKPTEKTFGHIVPELG